MPLMDFLPDNPALAADWRWRRAAELTTANGEGWTRRLDDEFVWSAHRFQDASRQADATPSAIYSKYPWLYRANAVRFADDQALSHTRWELEARLLAGSNNVEISLKLGLNPDAVQVYERTFFAVRDRLTLESWIMHHVVGVNVHGGLQARHTETLWKLFAYFGGPHILDVLVTTFNRLPHPTHADGAPQWQRETATGDLIRQAMVAAKCFNINAFSQSELLKLFHDVMTLERTTDANRQQNASYVNNVAIMLKAFFGGNPNTAKVTAPKQQVPRGVELRSHELVAAAAGQTLDLEPGMWIYPEKDENEEPRDLTLAGRE